MKNYSLTCAYCDSEFESRRSDALYCSNSCRTMNSRDNKLKEQANDNSYNLNYSEDENELIENRAEIAGMEVDEYIKFISMHTKEDYSTYITEINDLSQENKELKAKLSFYTEDIEGGILLNIDEETISEIYKNMKFYDRSFDNIEDFVVYASTNLKQIIKDTIDKVISGVTEVIQKKE